MSIWQPKICLIGDSTMQETKIWLHPQTKAVITDLSISGGDTAGQKAAWLALSEAARLDFDYVLIQIGLNDLGIGGKTSAQLIPLIQDLFDTVKGDIKSTSKIISSTMTPCRESIGETAYPYWLTVNEAYRGEGASAFVADLYCNYHTDKLNDGNGNLAPALDDGSHIHAISLGREYCADAYREKIDYTYYQ
jgi:lysophospholipase L1-like esterase